MFEFLLVIPTLNEDKYIGSMLSNSEKELRSIYSDGRFLIVVADAGSEDATISVVERFMKNHRNVVLTRSSHIAERGYDVMHAMSMHKSKLYCYIDADLAPSLPYLKRAITKSAEGYDLVLGSRYLRASITRRPAVRRLFSIVYNGLIRNMFSDGITDHQCGFRIFNRKAFRVLSKKSTERHWVWDTEVILIARHSNLKIIETPIKWVEQRSDKTNYSRLLKDILLFIPGIARLIHRFILGRELG